MSISDAKHRVEVHLTLERGRGPRPWRASSEHRDHDLDLALIRRHDAGAAEAMEALDSGALACGR